MLQGERKKFGIGKSKPANDIQSPSAKRQFQLYPPNATHLSNTKRVGNPGNYFPQRTQWWGSDIQDVLRGHRMKMSGLGRFEVALGLVFSTKISGLTPLARLVAFATGIFD